MNLRNIKVSQQHSVINIQIDRPHANNSMNMVLIEELTAILKSVEENADCKIVVLSGNADAFCTGMDFRDFTDNQDQYTAAEDPSAYYDLLLLLSNSAKVIISKVDGRVNAGGVGIVAASDIVVASRTATFALSEVLFGLLPACVMPFLIRRVGMQKAQWLTLTTQAIPSNRAFEIGLVDEVVDDTADAVRKSLLRLARLNPSTIRELKKYMSALWIMDDQTKQYAVTTITNLLASGTVQNNIKNFVHNGKFPWDK